MDLYQEITNRIIVALETGTAPWVKPWSSLGIAHNAVTGREYSGINTLLLSFSTFSSNAWLTFAQAKAVGGKVRKGEVGTHVVLYKPFVIKDKNNDDSKERTIPLLKSFVVFNTQQIDNLPTKFTQPIISNPNLEVNEIAEHFMSQARFETGDRACFRPSDDLIIMPGKCEFKTVDDYYSTALHELTHWSGHASRLSRDFSGRFGDSAYAFEELIAELGSCFLCSASGIDGHLQHANYIASWLKVLKQDKRAIFTAAASAKKSADFIMGIKEVLAVAA